MKDWFEFQVGRGAYYSVRSTSVLQNTWNSARPEIDCLMKHRGFVLPPVETLALNLLRNAREVYTPCNISAVSPAEFKKNGVFNFTIKGCPSKTLSSDYFTGKFRTVCAAFVAFRRVPWLYMDVKIRPAVL